MKKAELKTYKKLSTEFYDLELTDHPNTAKVLDFYMDYAIKARGPILEPMCGTGRFLIPMLQKGLEIEGFDASSHMLNALEQKHAKISTLKAPVWQQFVEDFESKKQYKLIFIPFGSWGLITNIGNSKKCLEKMYDNLAPDGKFVIEIETITSLPEPCNIWCYGSHTRDDGSRLNISTFASYNSQTQMFSSICEYKSFKENRLEVTESENFEQYLYRFDEMDQLLQDSGFTKFKKYIDYSKSPATDSKAPIIIYECTKQL